jgi:hypothetical protein
MVQFEIEHLSANQLMEAWPIVRMSDTYAHADWWAREAAELIDRGGGVLAVRVPGGDIQGVATYEVVKKALLGRVLAVGALITFELSRRAPARRALCDAIDQLGTAFDCRSLIVPLPSNWHNQRRARALYRHLDFEAPREVG